MVVHALSPSSPVFPAFGNTQQLTPDFTVLLSQYEVIHYDIVPYQI